jgi:hypothetical protein
VFYEGYNPLAQAISDLTALNSPSRNIAGIFSTLYGICAVTFSIGFLHISKIKLINLLLVLHSFFAR